MEAGQVAGPRLRSNAFVGDASFAAKRPASVQQRGVLQVWVCNGSERIALTTLAAARKDPPYGQKAQLLCTFLQVCAGLKDTRDRINSIKNTQKITDAMKLVAAAKVRRAQDAVVNGRPFSENLVKVSMPSMQRGSPECTAS